MTAKTLDRGSTGRWAVSQESGLLVLAGHWDHRKVLSSAPGRLVRCPQVKYQMWNPFINPVGGPPAV